MTSSEGPFSIERAHLRDATGWTPPIFRYPPGPSVADLVRRYWVPVWSLPPDEVTVQRVLQYPVCQLVVAHDYAQLVGVATGLGIKELRGAGWAFGTMLQPAAASLVLGGPVSAVTDGAVDLADVAGLDGASLTREVRALLQTDPSSEAAHLAAISVVEAAVAELGPVDDDGLLLNQLVEYVETTPGLTRVGQLCDEFHVSERSLQRLTARRLGLSPKWLIQRRRLHEAAGRLRTRASSLDLAAAAADLGYADQAHFIRDFKTVTGLTPGAFAAEPRP